MRCNISNELFSDCTNISALDSRRLALVRGSVGAFCFVLCLATFLFELFYISRKRKSTTLQRLFIYLTFSNLLYTAVLSLHAEHYFNYDSKIQCYFCIIIGFFDQYTGSVQLLLTMGIVFKLFHKACSPCRVSKFRGQPTHHLKFEALFIAACFVLPCLVIWVPILNHGLGGYGLDGPWCWIQELEDDCTVSRKGFHEQLLLWYIPYAIVSSFCLACIVAITFFLVYVHCRYSRKHNIKGVRVIIMDMILLLPFLVVFCCVCFVEITVVIFLKLQHSHRSTGLLESYVMWMFYAISTPIGGVVIPIAFFVYFIRRKNFTSREKHLGDVTNVRTVGVSNRVSVNSHTSQQERTDLLSRSGEEDWNTPDGWAAVSNPSRSLYGSVDTI